MRRKKSWRRNHYGKGSPCTAYHQKIEEMADFEKSYPWLENTDLQDSTEALIVAQEQILNTRAGVYHPRQDPRYRLCKDVPEHLYRVWVGSTRVKMYDTFKRGRE